MSLAQAAHDAIDFFEANPGKWTRGAYARDKLGYRVTRTSVLATCFCTVGALTRNTPGHIDGLLEAKYGLTGEDIDTLIKANDSAESVAGAISNLKELTK